MDKDICKDDSPWLQQSGFQFISNQEWSWLHTQRPLVNATGWSIPLMQSRTEIIPFAEEGLLRICGNILVILTVYISWTKDGMLANIQSRKKQWTILLLRSVYSSNLLGNRDRGVWHCSSQMRLTVTRLDCHISWPSYNITDDQDVNRHFNRSTLGLEPKKIT